MDDEGLADNTLVFFIGDHGVCNIRGKQFLYDEGTRIPMVVRWPGKIESGTVNEDLVSALDICSTVLDVGKASSPVALHGKSLLKDGTKNRKYLFAARDKMGGTHDAMRSMMARLSASLEQHRAQYPVDPQDDTNVLRPQIPKAVAATP